MTTDRGGAPTSRSVMDRGAAPAQHSAGVGSEVRDHLVVAVVPTIVGARVTLRAPRAGDVRARMAAGRDPEIVLGYGQRVEAKARLSRAEARAWLSRVTSEDWSWVIEHEGEAVGQIRLHALDLAQREAFVALGLFRSDLLGRGLGSDALRALMRWAVGDPLALEKLRLRVAEYNARAITSYRKCGFVEDRRVERAFELDGRWHADLLMSARLRPTITGCSGTSAPDQCWPL